MSNWTPVSEKLPEKGTYLCTIKGASGDFTYIDILNFSNDLYSVDEFDFYNKKGKAGFYSSDPEWGSYEVDDVIAYMPLPEPYKGE